MDEQLELFDLSEFSNFKIKIPAEQIDEIIEDLKEKTKSVQTETSALEREHSEMLRSSRPRKAS